MSVSSLLLSSTTAECLYCGDTLENPHANYCGPTHKKAAQRKRKANPNWVPLQCFVPHKIGVYSNEIDAINKIAKIKRTTGQVLYHYKCPGCKKFHLTKTQPKGYSWQI